MPADNLIATRQLFANTSVCGVVYRIAAIGGCFIRAATFSAALIEAIDDGPQRGGQSQRTHFVCSRILKTLSIF